MGTQFEVVRGLREHLREAELNPEARRRLDELLRKAERGDETALKQVEQLALERGYLSVPGENIPLPPGPLLVCPVDPDHCQTFQREVGEASTCPEHGVALVPAHGVT